MKNKEEKAQETIIKREYEKPVLIIISSKESRGKFVYSGEVTTSFGRRYGSS
jgi:hypothetical protein